MITNMDFDTFWNTNREVAGEIARNQLWRIKGKMVNWDRRIDDDAICDDSIVRAMQIVYDKYVPSRGNLYGMLKTVLHNEMSDLVTEETARLSQLKGIGPCEEIDYTWDQMAAEIHDSYMDDLITRLRYAIGQLKPLEQAIIEFYIDDPKTYVEESIEEFGIKPEAVYRYKNRALKKIPALMGMAPSMESHISEELQDTVAFGFLTVKTPEPEQANFVYPEFNMETTVTRIANKIRILKGEI